MRALWTVREPELNALLADLARKVRPPRFKREIIMAIAARRCCRLALIGAALLLPGCAAPYRTPYDGPPPLAYPAPGPVYSEPPPAYYPSPYPEAVPGYYVTPRAYVPGPTLYLEERLREDRRREELRREEFRRDQERRRFEDVREAERRQREQRPTVPVAPPRAAPAQPPVVQAPPPRAAPQPPQSAPRREPERRRPNDCDPARRNRCD
jgi:hypothetical protein